MKAKRKIIYEPDLWPVYEFRPLPDHFKSYLPIHRYAEGKWIPDDGEYDLAFAVPGRCLMVQIPYQKNIIWKWYTKHWSEFEPNHLRGNAWHYMLRPGETEWGGDWGSDKHPNSVAGRNGMNFACKETRCANGSHVEFDLRDKHIAAGLLRERDTKKIVIAPTTPICRDCGPIRFEMEKAA